MHMIKLGSETSIVNILQNSVYRSAVRGVIVYCSLFLMYCLNGSIAFLHPLRLLFTEGIREINFLRSPMMQPWKLDHYQTLL